MIPNLRNRTLCAWITIALTLALIPLSAQAQKKNHSSSLDGEALKYYIEGNDYSNRGEFEKAIESYKKSLKANDLVGPTHYNLGNILVATDKLKDAVAEYQRAIDLNPLIAEYHRNQGYAYALLQNGDMAKKKYEALKMLSPKHAEELLLWIKTANESAPKNPDPSGK